jgi:hypothetical protein
MPDKNETQKPIENHWELEVYQLAFEGAQRIYELSKRFPQLNGIH